MLKRIKGYLFVTVVISVSIASLCQSAPQPATHAAAQSSPAKTNPLEIWRDCTVSFGNIERDQLGQTYYKAIGTGVVFRLNIYTGYIVTARHVFYDPEKNYHPSEIRVRYTFQQNEDVYKQFGLVIPLRNKAGDDLWISLDDTTDLAAISVNAVVENQMAAIPDWLASADELYDGENIVALGFPGIVGNDYLIRPISRGGIVAWTDPVSPENHRFLIDSNIYPGNSGGPVIRIPRVLEPNSKVTMLGIVVEAPSQFADLSLNVPGLKTPLKVHEEVPIGGTGIVEPAAKVKALLAKAPVR